MMRREVALFLVIGSLTVMVDYMVYRSLFWMGLAGIDTAKALSFLVGTVLAYFAHRRWTFSHKLNPPSSAWRFAFLYVATLCANVVVNALTLALLIEAVAATKIAFLLATGVSASLNFLGMKLLVFRSGSLRA